MMRRGKNLPLGRGGSIGTGPVRTSLVRIVAILCLLAIGAYALLGPTGFIARSDYQAALRARTAELAELEKERDALRNRQHLLDQDNVDPDLAGELMRKELNVVAPDEVVVPLK
jgi:cell division protein FtsB